MLELIQVEIQEIVNLLSKDPYPDEKMKQTKYLLIRLKNNLRKLRPIEARQMFLAAQQSYQEAASASVRRYRTQVRDRKVIDLFHVIQIRLDKWYKDS